MTEPAPPREPETARAALCLRVPTEDEDLAWLERDSRLERYPIFWAVDQVEGERRRRIRVRHLKGGGR